MFYYSIGAAVAIRVSNYVGRGNQAEVRRSTWAGYHILLAMVVAVSFLLYFAKEPLVGIFTDDSIVAASAMALILPLIIYQCGDATQICFANALRGTGQSMSMMWIAFVSYILVGIPSGWLLGFPLGLRDVGIFYAFSIARLWAVRCSYGNSCAPRASISATKTIRRTSGGAVSSLSRRLPSCRW